MTEPTPAGQEARRKTARQSLAPPRWQRWWRVFASTIAVAVTLVGLGSATLSYLPRITLEMAPASDPQNSFSLLATIANTGQTPIEDVRIYLGICELFFSIEPLTHNIDRKCGPDDYSLFHRTDGWYAKEIAPDDKKQISWGDLFMPEGEMKVRYAQLSIAVEYRPAFWPFKRRRSFGYSTRVKSDGTVEWLYAPVD